MSFDLAGAIAEIRDAGLQRCETQRMDDARKALDFYRGDFTLYPVKQQSGSSYDEYRFQVQSLLMKRVVDTLTANLYADGPQRLLADAPEASAWLEDVYRKNALDALMQEADALSTVADACAIQVDATEDPDRPIKLTLWDASAFTVWLDPDDQREPVAVAVVDKFDHQRRMRIYTAAEVATLVTRKWDGPGQTAGATAYELQGVEPNPSGVLPFAFVHHKFPAVDFWSGSPGDNLQLANDYANFLLTDSSDTLRYSGKPIIAGYNTVVGWRPQAPVRPGDIWDVPSGDADSAGGGDAAHLDMIQADLGFVEAHWAHLQGFLDHTLEMNGVPPGTIRMKVEAASGVAIVAEQVPLILWAERRQRPFGHYEGGLARLVLTVGAAHLGAQQYLEYRATAGQLRAAARRLSLVLRWRDMFPDLPGPDRDAADSNALEMGITSRTRILMRRGKLTLEEAASELEAIAAERRREAELLGPAWSAPGAAPGRPATPPDPKAAGDEDRDPGEADDQDQDQDQPTGDDS